MCLLTQFNWIAGKRTNKHNPSHNRILSNINNSWIACCHSTTWRLNSSKCRAKEAWNIHIKPEARYDNHVWWWKDNASNSKRPPTHVAIEYWSMFPASFFQLMQPGCIHSNSDWYHFTIVAFFPIKKWLTSLICYHPIWLLCSQSQWTERKYKDCQFYGQVFTNHLVF